MAIRFGRIVSIIKPAQSGRFGAMVVKVSLQGSKYEHTAYAKELPEQDIIIEIICALLGKKLNLPIPEPLVVLSLDGTKPCFASMDASHPDMNSRLNINPDTSLQNTSNNFSLLQLLSRWNQIVDAICFDEWIANADRNTGNILFDGNETFTLIDHNQAMRELDIPTSHLKKNQLLNIKKIFIKDDISKQRLKNQLQLYVDAISSGQAKEIGDALDLALENRQTTTIINVVKFLEQRLNSLSTMATSKITTQQQSLH